MLISSPMTGTQKKCRYCKTTQDASDFVTGRHMCISCKANQVQTRISESYENYLQNLYSQSKSGNSKGSARRGLSWSIELEHLIDLWQKQGGRCAVSGAFLTHHKDGTGKKEYNASIDRISPDKDYTPDNIQLVCYRVNIMKHNLSEDMFYWWVKTIHDFSCD